ECLALRAAALRLGGWRLLGARVYVTLEPCPMCAGAVQQARCAALVFGAPDPKLGAAGAGVGTLRDPPPPHPGEGVGGVLAAEALGLLRRFFAERRPD